MATKTTIQKILDLTRQLYPTGRAWSLRQNSVFGKLHGGLAESEKAIYDELNNILFAVLPDNDNFSETDADNWEKALGLISDTETDFDTRKEAIKRKINHPGTIPARQHYLYLERELQAAGFDLYVHENRFADGTGGFDTLIIQASNCGLINCGASNSGAAGVADFEMLLNSIDAAKDAGATIGGEQNLRATFFISGATFPDRGDAVKTRERELRDLILSIKPAHTAAILLIDYATDNAMINTYNQLMGNTYGQQMGNTY